VSDSQITVGELIAQLQECPQDALVDCMLECPGYQDYPFEVMIAEDENLSVVDLRSVGGCAWVNLRGFVR
jgi:hypothetical protein